MQTQCFSAQDAAILKGISTRDVYRLIEEEEIHFIETEAKVIYVCPKFVI